MAKQVQRGEYEKRLDLERQGWIGRMEVQKWVREFFFEGDFYFL